MTTENLMTDAATPEGTGSQTAAPEGTAQAAPAGEANQQQASDQQAADQANADDAANSDAPKGAPETYEFKDPEGSSFDAKVIEEFASVAKELDMPQDAAQKIIDKVGPVIAARQAEQRDATIQQWAADAKTDKEFGGDKLSENLSVAKKKSSITL